MTAENARNPPSKKVQVTIRSSPMKTKMKPSWHRLRRFQLLRGLRDLHLHQWSSSQMKNKKEKRTHIRQQASYSIQPASMTHH
jgi:hypothetical protein